MNVSDKLRWLRYKKRKTLSEQSKALEVSLETLYRWENGITKPNKSIRSKVAAYHDVSVEWLFSQDASTSLADEFDKHLLEMFKELPNNSKYKVLGFVDRMLQKAN